MNTPYPPSEQKVKKFYNLCAFVVSFADMAPLPLREQRYPFLRYQGLEYTDADIAKFEERLERIYSREIHRVQVVYFMGMPKLMRDGLFARMVMEHRNDAGVVLGGARRRLSLRKFILALGLHTEEKMKSPRFARTSPSYTLIRDPVLRLCHRMMAHNIAGRSQAPKKVTVTDLFYLRGLDVGSVNIPYLLARNLRRFAAGRKEQVPYLLVGQSVARFAEHFELLTAKILGGLMVIAPELPIIDMGELGGQADPSPVQALPPPPAAAKTMPQRMARLKEDVHEIHEALTEQREVIDAMAHDFSRFSTWAVTGLTSVGWTGLVVTYGAHIYWTHVLIRESSQTAGLRGHNLRRHSRNPSLALTKVFDSSRLHDKMKVVFVQARSEDESFAGLMRDLCFSLRISLSRKRRLIAELEALGERGDAFRSLDHMREIVARDSCRLGVLEQLFACTHVGMRLTDGYVADMEEKE
ncbi:hypothetical protein Tco_1256154 [Tanacetum coccineum]